MSKENKKKLQQGSKNRAGRLLSGYLRSIAQEMTEVADVATGPDTVEHMIISKAEALARDMFEQAMNGADAKLKLEYRKLILDRIEGRAGDKEDGGKQDRTVPDRISDLNRDRLNAAAKEIAQEES